MPGRARSSVASERLEILEHVDLLGLDEAEREVVVV
jgi:hypothetical protein